MKAKLIASIAAAILMASVVQAQQAKGGQKGGGQRDPAAPKGPPPAQEARSPAERYTIEQAVSDKAQLNTISFDGLAFLTGSFGADTFLPPGKAADFFGFQYMRDIDLSEGGHNQNFLTNIANNALAILSDAQKKILVDLATEQAPQYAELARMRFPLIKAFREQLEGGEDKLLSRDGVADYVSSIFLLDGKMAYRRAQAYGKIWTSLSAAQKAKFKKLSYNDSKTWPPLPDQADKRVLGHEREVAVMTYASEFFSWYAGSIEGDVYFCPERHGTYFGGFYMKDYPAAGNPDYYISTTLTGDSGEAFVAALTPAQAERITGIINEQRSDLSRLVEVRRLIATELRKFSAGKTPDSALVLRLAAEYGAIDGRISWLYGSRFAEVGKSLTAEQKVALGKIRNQDVLPEGGFLYSDPIDLPAVAVPASLRASR